MALFAFIYHLIDPFVHLFLLEQNVLVLFCSLTKMEFLKSTIVYFRAFYYLGLSPCLPEHIQPSNWIIRIVRKVPVFVQATIGLTMSISIIITEFRNCDRKFYGRTEVAILNMVATCEIMRTLFVLIHCIFYERLISEMVYIFQKLESFFALQLRYHIWYDELKRAYLIKVILVAGAFIQYMVLFILRGVLYKKSTIHGVQIEILQALTAATFLHVIFYIEILSFYMDQLNLVIESDRRTHKINTFTIFFVNDFRSNIRIRNRLNHYKLVHFYLWEVSKKISYYFGWCMVVMFLHAFIVFFYSAYWMYIQLQLNSVPFRFIREYSCTFVY